MKKSFKFINLFTVLFMLTGIGLETVNSFTPTKTSSVQARSRHKRRTRKRLSRKHRKITHKRKSRKKTKKINILKWRNIKGRGMGCGTLNDCIYRPQNSVRDAYYSNGIEMSIPREAVNIKYDYSFIVFKISNKSKNTISISDFVNKHLELVAFHYFVDNKSLHYLDWKVTKTDMSFDNPFPYPYLLTNEYKQNMNNLHSSLNPGQSKTVYIVNNNAHDTVYAYIYNNQHVCLRQYNTI